MWKLYTKSVQELSTLSEFKLAAPTKAQVNFVVILSLKPYANMFHWDF